MLSVFLNPIINEGGHALTPYAVEQKTNKL